MQCKPCCEWWVVYTLLHGRETGDNKKVPVGIRNLQLESFSVKPQIRSQPPETRLQQQQQQQQQKQKQQ